MLSLLFSLAILQPGESALTAKDAGIDWVKFSHPSQQMSASVPSLAKEGLALDSSEKIRRTDRFRFSISATQLNPKTVESVAKDRPAVEQFFRLEKREALKGSNDILLSENPVWMEDLTGVEIRLLRADGRFVAMRSFISPTHLCIATIEYEKIDRLSDTIPKFLDSIIVDGRSISATPRHLPRPLVEYFDRSTQIKMRWVAKYEADIQSSTVQMRSVSGAKRTDLKSHIQALKDDLQKTKASRFEDDFRKAAIDEMGTLDVVTILIIEDDSNALVECANGTSALIQLRSTVGLKLYHPHRVQGVWRVVSLDGRKLIKPRAGIPREFQSASIPVLHRIPEETMDALWAIYQARESESKPEAPLAKPELSPEMEAERKLSFAKPLVDKEDKGPAKKRLTEIIDEFPGTKAANKATILLKLIKSDIR